MRKLLLVVPALLLGGCNFWYNEVPSPDDLMHVVPWFDHMILSKAVHPYQRDDIPRTTPAGIVPVGGAEAEWGTGDPLATPRPRYGFDQAVANTVTRPTDLAPVAAGRGQALFEVYCALCHGPAGAGNGTIPIGAPPINTARTAGFSDGYLYSYIRYGGIATMPAYGDKIPARQDRWAVVDYVRSLSQGVQP